VTNAAGGVIAALNTSGYSGLVTEEQLIKERLASLQTAAAAIGQLMTSHPNLLQSFVTDPNGAQLAAPAAKATPTRTKPKPASAR
jgi:hypothetical protein